LPPSVSSCEKTKKRILTEANRENGGCAIPELGFVRVSVQRTAGHLPLADAAAALSGMLLALGRSHAFVPDDLSSVTPWLEWCQSASRSTDAHLAALADRHGLRLATLDEGIPASFLIPADP
jgi:predicted nucleic acid-binding protein